MTSLTSQRRLEPHLEALLSALRWRIRAYVWIEGLALCVAWVILVFWLAFALDYLPVLLGFSEMPWPARAFILVVIGVVSSLILYRWILRRAFVRLADHSMAVLLERRFTEFHDSLVTAVEMTEHPDHAVDFNRDMLARTNRDALSQIGQIRLRQVFNPLPLLLSTGGACALGLTVAAFAFFFTDAFLLASGRLFLLDDATWPRSSRIEVLGVEVQQQNPVAGADVGAQFVPFKDGTAKVAKGSSVVLLVQADAAAERVVPQKCTVIYRTDEGDRGRVNMKRIGQPKDGYQQYTFDEKPFKGILSSIHFDVVGFDHRVRRLVVEVVDSPVIVETQLDCVFPSYLVDPATSAWTPRTVAWHPGTELPRGTSVTLKCRTNKPLEQVDIYNPKTETTETVEIVGEEADRERFSFPIPRLDEDLTLEIRLHDTDGVLSDNPFYLSIVAVPDEAPKVKVRLRGIGSAVTPDVQIPFEGTIQDTYSVESAWIEVRAPGIDIFEEPVPLDRGGAVKMAIDFRAKRQDKQHGFTLPTGNKSKLVLVVKAADRFDLGDHPNIGGGEPYELDLVTPDELLAILERLEAGQRRFVEQIYREMSEARDYLLRIKTLGASPGDPELEKTPAEPGAEPLPAVDPAKAAQRLQALRLLFAQRALLQTRKSAQEVLGIAATFRDLREQLINNRIDSEDRKQRLKDEIADPLERIGAEMFPELDRRLVDLDSALKQLEKRLNDQTTAAGVDKTNVAATQQAQLILDELDVVLQKLVKFESYNELLDIVRELIDDQEKLIEETKQEQERQALEDLID